jgi:hypothetical protein
VPTRSTLPQDLSQTENPWIMLAALADAGVDVSPLESRFFELVAERRSALERDALLAAGLSVFRYRLRDALGRVELAILERTHAL